MKGIDQSYHYEGYNVFRTEDMVNKMWREPGALSFYHYME